jgi:hypothetical protein
MQSKLEERIVTVTFRASSKREKSVILRRSNSAPTGIARDATQILLLGNAGPLLHATTDPTTALPALFHFSPRGGGLSSLYPSLAK